MLYYTPIDTRIMANFTFSFILEPLKRKHVLEWLLSTRQLQSASPEDILDQFSMHSCMNDTIRKFLSKLISKWQDAGRQRRRMFIKNEEWLNSGLPNCCCATAASSSTAPGRPSVPFAEASSKTKQRQTETLRRADTMELAWATQVKLRARGQVELSKTIKKTLFHEGLDPKPGILPYTSEEALALCCDARLSQDAYQFIRNGASSRNAKSLYPTYKKVQDIRNQCQPLGVTISNAAQRIQVPLQSTLDFVAARILSVIEASGPISISPNLKLISKWGMDGSSGYSLHQSKPSTSSVESEIPVDLDVEGDEVIQDDNGSILDELSVDLSSTRSVFIVCLTPLLVEDSNHRPFWTNPKPGGSIFCKPIALIFEKESSILVREQMTNYHAQIDNLIPTELLTVEGQIIRVTHELHLTMADMKIINILTNTTSSQVCYVCGAKPTDRNDLGKVRNFKVKDGTLSFGISSLHAWIRSCEFFLKIAYSLKIKKPTIRGQDKQLFQLEKRRIQALIKGELGLVVDQPLSSGSGTTTTGNTARKLFANADVFSRITCIDLQLIENMNIILSTLNSGFSINLEKFDTLLRATAERLVTVYPWTRMTPTVHKILIHGIQIIEAAPLPIGVMSEESLESRTKDIRYLLTNHCRRISKSSVLEDLFRGLQIYSDPIVASLRKPAKSFKWYSGMLQCAPYIVSAIPPDSYEED